MSGGAFFCSVAPHERHSLPAVTGPVGLDNLLHKYNI
jgi:hypothetical protein